LQYHVVVLDVGPSMSRHPQRKRDAVDAVTELLVNMVSVIVGARLSRLAAAHR